jgi:2-hydroxyglutarate dehydrogenase
VAAYSALWSPNTGIVDYGVVTRSLAQDVLETGRADIKLQFQVESLTYNAADGRVIIKGVEPGQPGPAKHVVAKNVVTCAGFYADRVAQLAGGAVDPKIVTFRGTYYQMKAPFKDIVRTNVYPVPSGGGIPVGVHFTPTVNERRGHQMIIGPGACVSFSREGYKITDISLSDLWDFAKNGGLWKFAITNPRLSIGEIYRDLNKAAFLKEAQKLVPSVTEDMVEESFTGVMAQVRLCVFWGRRRFFCGVLPSSSSFPPLTYYPFPRALSCRQISRPQVFESDGSAAKDYIFERKCMNGTVLNVRNAPSPACTASLAIAEQVVDVAEQDFGWGKK